MVVTVCTMLPGAPAIPASPHRTRTCARALARIPSMAHASAQHSSKRHNTFWGFVQNQATSFRAEREHRPAAGSHPLSKNAADHDIREFVQSDGCDFSLIRTASAFENETSCSREGPSASPARTAAQPALQQDGRANGGGVVGVEAARARARRDADRVHLLERFERGAGLRDEDSKNGRSSSGR